MMKRFIFVSMLTIFLFQPASAQVMRQLNVSVDVQDFQSEVMITFRFTEEIKEIDFPFSGKISDIETQFGNCKVLEGFENKLKCEPPSPFMVGEITIKTRFKARGLTKRHGNISLFSLDIPILWKTEKVWIEVKLPNGMFLAEEKVLLPFSPSGAEKKIEGKRLILSWFLMNKRSGDLIPIRIYYEPLTPLPIQDFFYKWIGIFILIFIVGFLFIYRSVSKKRELILSVLNEAERVIVDIIRKEGGKKVDQRKVVALSGFSKAKVSRIVKSLEGRGVLSVERVGRKNRISLKRIILEE